MTDKELLKLAANACGATVIREAGDAGLWINGPNGRHLWNPLCIDGQAFRLAVAMQASIYFNEEDCPGHIRCVSIHPMTFMVGVGQEPLQGDHADAARRAIVRSAANAARPY